MTGARENEFIAQIKHEHARVALIERAKNGRISLGGKNDGGAEPHGSLQRRDGQRKPIPYWR